MRSATLSLTGDGRLSYESLLHSAVGGRGHDNGGGYSNPAMDKLIERGLGRLTHDERRLLLARLATKVALDVPIVPLVRSFDRGSPASARRRDSRRTAAETPKVSVDTSTRPTPSAPAAAVSRTTMLAFSALGNTDALATSRRMSRPDIGLAMTPTVASATSRWRLTRQPLACCSPIALPARRRRACRVRIRVPQPLTRVTIVV